MRPENQGQFKAGGESLVQRTFVAYFIRLDLLLGRQRIAASW